jgi:predicted membrane protein
LEESEELIEFMSDLIIGPVWETICIMIIHLFGREESLIEFILTWYFLSSKTCTFIVLVLTLLSRSEDLKSEVLEVL